MEKDGDGRRERGELRSERVMRESGERVEI